MKFANLVTGTNYRIIFVYPDSRLQEVNGRRSRDLGDRVVCILQTRRDGRWVDSPLQGEARRNRKAGDVFRKEDGRKRALARALRTLPRGVRTAAWYAYHERTTQHSKPLATMALIA